MKQAYSNFNELVTQSTGQFRPMLYLTFHCIQIFGNFVVRASLVPSTIFLKHTRRLELKFYVVLALLEYSVACVFSHLAVIPIEHNT